MTQTDATSIEDRLARLEELAAAGARAKDRGDVENLFSTYMYLHNAFRDEEIIPLWVERGTRGIAPSTATWASTRPGRASPSTTATGRRPRAS